MKSDELILLIISIIVVLFFSIAYICLFSMYYSNRKKLILSNLLDKEIKRKLNKDIYKFNKKNKNTLSFKEYYFKKKKSNKVFSFISNTIFSLFVIACIVIIILISFIHTNTSLIFINNSTYLVIQSDSMKETNENNTYLKDNNSKYINTRFSTYDLISLDKLNSEDELELYDIVAFKYEEQVTVHRLISINEIEGVKYYTFRGDSNPSSLNEEVNLTFDYLIGKYTGFTSSTLGHIVTYLKSSVGYISIFACFVVLGVNFFFLDKSDKTIIKRYEELLEERYFTYKYVEEDILTTTSIYENKEDIF